MATKASRGVPWKRARHLTSHRRVANTQLKTVDGAVRVLSWLGVMGRSERRQMEVYLWREGVQNPLAELQQAGYALWANLKRKSAAEPVSIALTEVEERAIMKDLRLLVKLFPKIAKNRQT